VSQDKVETRIDKWVRSEIRSLSAYHVPDPGEMVKLDAMENPYHWPEKMVDDWFDVLKNVELNRYPDPSAKKLTEQLRIAMQVPQGADIILGNGSDELIQMIAMTLSSSRAGKANAILSVEPGFVMYRMIATFADMEYIGVPLNDDFSLNETAVLNAIDINEPAVIFIAYPNNPTGNLFDINSIKRIIQAAPGVVVVDEAYHAFADSSFMLLLNDYDNLLVMRTVSKMGLAGLRLGLLAGNPKWLDEFDKVRLPYNINILTQASAEFAMQHIAVLEQQTQQICVDREILLNDLALIDGVHVFPSKANFILVRVAQDKADGIFNTLKEKGILIKNLSPVGGLLKDCLRITVGTPEENKQFIEAFKKSL